MRQASVKMDVVGVTKRNIADNYHPLVGWGLLIGIWLGQSVHGVRLM